MEADKENILQTEDHVEGLIDKLGTLNLGESKSSQNKKFNLNAWSTPLKAIGNIRLRRDVDFESTAATSTELPKYLTQIFQTCNTTLSSEQKLSIIDEKGRYNSDRNQDTSVHDPDALRSIIEETGKSNPNFSSYVAT